MFGARHSVFGARHSVFGARHSVFGARYKESWHITFMGGTLFRKVAAVAHLKKRDLKRLDKTPRNYDQTRLQ